MDAGPSRLPESCEKLKRKIRAVDRPSVACRCIAPVTGPTTQPGFVHMGAKRMGALVTGVVPEVSTEPRLRQVAAGS